MTGLHFGEGPRRHDGRLWFSDFPVELEIDDQPSGLGWLPDGSLVVVAMTK